jgi:hypothetical protein
MVKCSSTASTNWHIHDAVRDPYNVGTQRLMPSSTAAEQTDASYYFDLVSNGLKWRGTNNNVNGSGLTYIGLAFGEPTKTAALHGANYKTNGTITQTTDTPTDSVADAVGNLLIISPTATSSSLTLSGGNKVGQTPADGTNRRFTGSIPTSGGKVYIEASTNNSSTTSGTPGLRCGIVIGASFSWDHLGSGTEIATDLVADTQATLKSNNGIIQLHIDGSLVDTFMSTGFESADRFLYAVDDANGKAWLGYYDDSAGTTTWADSSAGTTGNPSAGTNPTLTWTTGTAFFAGDINGKASGAIQNTLTIYTESGEWVGAIPTGFTEWGTQAATSVTDGNLDNHWSTVLWTGDGVDGHEIDTGLPDVNFAWLKGRSLATGNILFDTIRGATNSIGSDSTGAEKVGTSGYLSSFNGDGTFDVASGTSSDNSSNNLNDTYVAWCASLPNTKTSSWSGSPTITPSKEIYNTTLGMSIVKYTGDGNAGATIPHSLGTKPFMIIFKRLDGTANWRVYHEALGATKHLVLNGTNTEITLSTLLNDTEPTSQVVTLGDFADSNGSGGTYLAYIFTETDFCKPISYTGNGNADGAFANLGISPEWTLLKRATGGTGNWDLTDTTRSLYNPLNDLLFPNQSSAESANPGLWDIVSNGIKLRTTDAALNASGDTYIGLAFGRPTQGGSKKISQSRAR